MVKLQQTRGYLRRRLFSAIIDLSLIVVYVVLLFGFTILMYRFFFSQTPAFNLFTAYLIGFVTLTLPVLAYFVITELGKYSGSFGKRKVGLKVVSMNTEKLTIKQVMIRNIIKLLPWEYAHILIYILILVPEVANSQILTAGLILANIIPLIYIILIVLRKDHRGPHDIISHTVVEDIQSDTKLNTFLKI